MLLAGNIILCESHHSPPQRANPDPDLLIRTGRRRTSRRDCDVVPHIRLTRVTETLPLTGERTAPGIWHENYWFARHDAAYRWITANLPIDPTGRVLDAGCGEGYGAELLRLAGAASVTGLDYEDTTLRHVRRVYPQTNVVRGNLVQTPFQSNAFLLVTSLQTIEHLWEQPSFVAECARILEPHGTVVL